MSRSAVYFVFVCATLFSVLRGEESQDAERLLTQLSKKIHEKKSASSYREDAGSKKELRGLLLEGLHALSEMEKRDHVEPMEIDWTQYECDPDYVALRRTVNSLFGKYCRKAEPPSTNVDNTCTSARKQCPDTSACCEGLKCVHWICREDEYKEYNIWHRSLE